MSAVEAGGRGLAEQLEGLGALGRGEGADDQPRGLARERLRQRRMAVAEARDRDAGEKIDEHVAVDVGERRALAMIEREAGEQRDTLAAGRDMALLVGEHRARIWPGNRRGDFRLEAGPARHLRLGRDRGSVGGLGSICRPCVLLRRPSIRRPSSASALGVCSCCGLPTPSREKYGSGALARPAREPQAAARDRAGRGLAYPAEAGPVVKIDHHKTLAVDHRITAPRLQTQGGGGSRGAPRQFEPHLLGDRTLSLSPRSSSSAAKYSPPLTP